MIGFDAVMRRAISRKRRGFAEVLDVHEDHAHRRVVLPVREQVVAAHVRLVADRDELRDADAVFAWRNPARSVPARPTATRRRRARTAACAGANVAFIDTAGSALRTPMQFGPTIRMPYRRTISHAAPARAPRPPPPPRGNPPRSRSAPSRRPRRIPRRPRARCFYGDDDRRDVDRVRECRRPTDTPARRKSTARAG